MDTNPSAEQIVARLAQFWELQKTPPFLNYLKDTFGTVSLTLPYFDCLYIAQAETGDPVQGWIGGLIKEWWIVDDNGIRPISNPDLPMFPNEPGNLRSGFYPSPVLKFYIISEKITIGESFGPTYICRKTATAKLRRGNLVEFFDCRIIWTSASLAQQ